EVAWRFKTESLGPRPEFNLESTPLMVKGALYFTAGTRRAAVAVDAQTGELLWVHSLNEGKRGEAAPRQLSGRGLSYWTDGREEREAAVDLPHDSACRRGRQRHVGEGLVVLHGQRRGLGADERGRRAGPRVPADRAPNRGLLRRQSPRQQSLRRECRGARRAD